MKTMTNRANLNDIFRPTRKLRSDAPDSPAFTTKMLYPATPEIHNPEPTKTSEWAKIRLDFHPSPKQAEVLDSAAKYLMLCCNQNHHHRHQGPP